MSYRPTPPSRKVHRAWPGGRAKLVFDERRLLGTACELLDKLQSTSIIIIDREAREMPLVVSARPFVCLYVCHAHAAEWSILGLSSQSTVYTENPIQDLWVKET